MLLAVMAAGEILTLPRWTEKYLELSRAARACYYVLSTKEDSARLALRDYQKFCPDAYPVITPAQALAIRRFLNGR